MSILCSISTKGRYDTYLPLAIQAVITQTRKVDKLVIFDDNDNPIDLRDKPVYKFLFGILDQKQIPWEVLYGRKKGQHFNHQMFEHIEKSSFENIKIKLTKRQDQIIDFLLRGDSYTDIAIQLNLSVNTVRKHITILYKKLKINNRTSLFKIKMHNLIDVN